jgi:hypothetical protein
MNETDIEVLVSTIQSFWNLLPSDKAHRYIGRFFERSRIGKKIVAKVHGNYGIYTVSIDIKKQLYNPLAVVTLERTDFAIIATLSPTPSLITLKASCR